MSTVSSTELTVQISKDRMSAVLQIPRGYPAEALSVDLCAAQFEAQDVQITEASLEQIERGVAAYQADPQQPLRIVLHGKLPLHGAPGRLELAPECISPHADKPAAPSAEGDTLADQQAEGNDEPSVIDHYSRSPYINVKAGQVIGRVIPPTEGEDGIDIKGNVVPARCGKPFALVVHDSIMVNAKGEILAQCQGTLEHFGTTLRVNSLLQIDGRVDFETGNIDFDGDVTIGQGVCDNFKVTAKRNAVINGVVEAAELTTGGDLTLTTGMFAKDKGSIKTGKTCRAKFLQQVRGQVTGSLIVDKEVVNSQLVVTGSVNSPHAALIGGECHVLGAAQFKTLGSDKGVRTVLHIGDCPEYDRLMDTAIAKLGELEKTIDKLTQKLAMIQNGARNLAAQTKEQLTELTCEQMSVQEEYDTLKELTDGLTERFKKHQSAEVTVNGMIFNGTVIALGHTAAEFIKPIKGPITVLANPRGELCYRSGTGQTQPIRAIARCIHWP